METGRSQGWFGRLWPLVQQGGPVTTMVLGLCAVVMVVGLYREVHRLHALNREAIERLLAERQAHVEWLRERVHCDTTK